MSRARQFVARAYRLIAADKASVMDELTRESGIFRLENLDELRTALLEAGATDPSAIRLLRLELIGDLFRELSPGPVLVFREVALEAYEIALRFAPRSVSLLGKSGAALYRRMRGDREDNLLRAVARLRACLVEAPLGSRDRGLAGNLMGLSLSELPSTIVPDGHDEAHRRFSEALQVFQDLGDRESEAMVFLNLGNHCARIGDTSSAVGQYRQALRRYLELDRPDDVALVERNLGVTLLDRADPRRSEDIEEAIAHLESSVARLPSERDGHAVAATLNNLGRAYALRIEGSQEENFLIAHDAFERAAIMFRTLGETSNSRISRASAGGISYELKDWRGASRHFNQAIELIDDEWRDRLTAHRLVQLARDGSRIFDFAVLTALNAGDNNEALRLLERGRLRVLADAYYSSKTAAPLGSCAELWEQVVVIRRKRAALRLKLTKNQTNPTVHGASTKTEEWRQGLEDLGLDEDAIIRQLRSLNPGFLPTAEPIDSLEVATLAKQLRAHICVAKPTSKGTILFAFTPDGSIRHTVVEAATSEYWKQLLLGEGGWAQAYTAFRTGRPFARYRWLGIMESTLREVHRTLIGPCLALMSLPAIEDVVPSGNPPRIFFLAGGMLDLLPLHAAFSETARGRTYLADVADVGYCPSLRMLEQSAHRSVRIGSARRLRTFQAPARALPFMKWEAAFASAMYGHEAVERAQMSKAHEVLEELTNRTTTTSMCLLSCHAAAKPNDGLGSGLFWASDVIDRPDISIVDLLGVEMPNCGLVVLAACETSLKEIDDPSDECLSLANTFLAVGVSAAIGTQWVANDVTSALWTAQFLLQYQDNQGDVLHSACEASRWIRDSDINDKVALLKSCPEALPEGFLALLEKDFTHPFLWANHKCYGASL